MFLSVWKVLITLFIANHLFTCKSKYCYQKQCYLRLDVVDNNGGNLTISGEEEISVKVNYYALL